MASLARAEAAGFVAQVRAKNLTVEQALRELAPSPDCTNHMRIFRQQTITEFHRLLRAPRHRLRATPPPSPWRRFSKWAKGFGVRKLAVELDTDPGVIYAWLRVNGPRPHWRTAKRMLRLARLHPCGVPDLHWNDLLGKP